MSSLSSNDIIVNGWSERYALAIRRLLATEGGFVDDPRDRGGTTKYGISLRFLKAEGRLDLDGDGFADFDLDMDGDIDGKDIRFLSRHDAKYLYHSCFWLRMDIESFPVPLGEALFDQGVNGGIRAARKMLQLAIIACYRKNPPNGLKLLEIDGVIGPVTRGALDAILQYPPLGMPGLMSAYRDAVAARYRGIVTRDPSQKRFLNGWLRRAAELGVSQ